MLVVFDAATLLLGAVSHLGIRISLGFATIAELQIIDATIGEGLSGLFLAVSAYALFTRKQWAWWSVLAAHAFALGGFLLGIGAISAGLSPRTELNDIYHRVMVVVLVSGLVLLLTPSAKAALGRGNQDSRRG